MNKEQQEKIDRRWKRFQEALGYTDDEIAKFRSDPTKAKAMERAPKFMTYNIIAECVFARNCNAGHREGQKIVMDGNGVILRDQCPERMCFAAIQAFASYLYGIWERFGDDLEDVCLLSDAVHCPDVGVERGGWGETIWRVYAEPKKRSAD